MLSQKLLVDYVSGVPDLKLVKVYRDNGETGTDFNRPGFDMMMNDLRKGLIDCIVVKDYCAIIGLNQKDLENQGILA